MELLTEKDINIFTIVKDKNNISPLRQWCIDSWHKCMPEANIMIFDHEDLTNPNWEYYDVIKDDKIYNFYIVKGNILFPDLSKTADGVCPLGTDSIRIRLLKAIPNALYMDSDAYLNITSEKFLEMCNTNRDADFSIHTFGPCIFDVIGYFAGHKSTFLDDLINYYNDVVGVNIENGTANISYCIDSVVVNDMLNSKSYSDYVNTYSDYISHITISTMIPDNKFIDMLIKNNKPVNVIIEPNSKTLVPADVQQDYISIDLKENLEDLKNDKRHNIKEYLFNKLTDVIKPSTRILKPGEVLNKQLSVDDFYIYAVNSSVYFNLKWDYIIDKKPSVAFIRFTHGILVNDVECLTKLKETFIYYLKPILDAGIEINFYKLNLPENGEPWLLEI